MAWADRESLHTELTQSSLNLLEPSRMRDHRLSIGRSGRHAGCTGCERLQSTGAEGRGRVVGVISGHDARGGSRGYTWGELTSRRGGNVGVSGGHSILPAMSLDHRELGLGKLTSSAAVLPYSSLSVSSYRLMYGIVEPDVHVSLPSHSTSRQRRARRVSA